MYAVSDHKTLDPREVAKRLGTLSIEERVQIIKSLLDAGPAGQQTHDIAASTGLGAPAINKQMEALIGAEMVTFKSADSSKTYFANVGMLNELFSYMLYQFGPGPQAPAASAETEAEQ